MFKKMILTAAVLAAVETGAVDGITIKDTAPAPKKTEQKAAGKAAERERAEKIAELNRRRTELIRKIHERRQDLLRNNPKLRRLYQQLLKLTKEIALQLNENREMRELNDELADVERSLKNELDSRPDTKPDRKPGK